MSLTDKERATINKAVAIMQDKLHPNASFMFSIRKDWFTRTCFDSLGRQHAMYDQTDNFSAVVDLAIHKETAVAAKPDAERDATIAYHRQHLAELAGQPA